MMADECSLTIYSSRGLRRQTGLQSPNYSNRENRLNLRGPRCPAASKIELNNKGNPIPMTETKYVTFTLHYRDNSEYVQITDNGSYAKRQVSAGNYCAHDFSISRSQTVPRMLHSACAYRQVLKSMPVTGTLAIASRQSAGMRVSLKRISS